jgi:hypothetical protein
MSQTDAKPGSQPTGDEKVVPIMVYTSASLCWGDVTVKEVIRVSTWLRTNNAPNFICLQNAKVLSTNGAQTKPVYFQELYLVAAKILAYHLIPPATDPLDYDPSEPHRKLEPVTAILGPFRLDGKLRMATISNLGHYIDVNRETFTSLYDVEISNPMIQGLGIIKVPFVLLRQAEAAFATRKV